MELVQDDSKQQDLTRYNREFGTREMRHQSKMNIGNTKTEVIETLRTMYIEDARTLDGVFEFC